MQGRNLYSRIKSQINVCVLSFFTSFLAILTDRIFSMILASSSGGSWGDRKTEKMSRLQRRRSVCVHTAGKGIKDFTLNTEGPHRILKVDHAKPCRRLQTECICLAYKTLIVFVFSRDTTKVLVLIFDRQRKPRNYFKYRTLSPHLCILTQKD